MKKLKTVRQALGYFLIFSLTPVVCALLISFVYILLNKAGFNPAQKSANLHESIACAIMILIFFILSKRKKNNFRESIKFYIIKPLSAILFILFGISVFFVLMIILNCLPFLGGNSNTSESVSALSMSGDEIFFLFLAKAVMAPIAEEITFRGLMYPKLKSAFPKIISCVIVSLVFGALHLSYSIFMLITSFLISMFFIYLLEKYNSIIPGILIHSAYNFVVTFIKYEFMDFGQAEIWIVVGAITIFVLALIGIIFNIRKMNNKA